VRYKSKADIEVKLGREANKKNKGKEKMVRKVVRVQERKYPVGNHTVERHWGIDPSLQAAKMDRAWRPINL
jgi:hypothetical protein